MIGMEKFGRPEKKPRTLAEVIVKVSHIRSPSFLNANLTIDLF